MDILQAVADSLVNRGFDVEVDYPGYLHIHANTGLYIAGTANGNWGADYYRHEDAFLDGEQPNGGLETNVPSSSDDAFAIADAIQSAIERFWRRGGTGL